MLDKILKLTTLLGTLLMFNGVVYLSIYYSNFGINIFSYLEFTEVILAFLDSLKNILSFFCIYLVHFALTFLLGFTQLLKFNKPKELKPGDSYVKPERINFTLIDKIFKIVILIQVFILAIISSLLAFDFIIINSWIIYAICFIVINLFHALIDSHEKILQFAFGKIYSGVLNAFIIFVLPFSIYTIACAEYDSLTKETSSNKIELIDNDNKRLKLVNGYELIGKTNKYVFLYNFNTKECISISLENIKLISYK